LDLVFKIAPISDHVAKFCGDRPRDRGDLTLNKKRKKRQQNKGRIVLSQRAALTNGGRHVVGYLKFWRTTDCQQWYTVFQSRPGH